MLILKITLVPRLVAEVVRAETSRDRLFTINIWPKLSSVKTSPAFEVKKIPSPEWDFGMVVVLPLSKSRIASISDFRFFFFMMLRNTPMPASLTMKDKNFSRTVTSTEINFDPECSIALLNISENANVKILRTFSGDSLSCGSLSSISRNTLCSSSDWLRYCFLKTLGTASGCLAM